LRSWYQSKGEKNVLSSRHLLTTPLELIRYGYFLPFVDHIILTKEMSAESKRDRELKTSMSMCNSSHTDVASSNPKLD
jgi:hypothetical protein